MMPEIYEQYCKRYLKWPLVRSSTPMYCLEDPSSTLEPIATAAYRNFIIDIVLLFHFF